MTTTLAGYIQGKSIADNGSSQYLHAHRESDGGKVIIKTINLTYPTLKDVARLKHEFNLLRKISSNSVLSPIEIIEQDNRIGIIFEGCNFHPLSEFHHEKNLNIEEFLRLAIGITKIIGNIHKLGVIHHDIKTSNFIYDGNTNELKLINFELASELDHQLQELKHVNTIDGTLSYISPEQTGRMNRPVTQSTDLYSLGITLYEIITGKLPFDDNDAITLIYNHIANRPVEPFIVDSRIPRQISDIIMKLIEKKSEDRYRSEVGLIADLEVCLEQYTKYKTVNEFKLGEKDISTKFEIPDKLYGREKEIDKIYLQFEEMCVNGNSELLLVSGNPGVGKTALINEVQKPLVAKHGEFIDGKIDQYQKDQPYLAMSQAFTKLVERILCENEENLAAWRRKIKTELGDLAQLMVDIIPALEHTVGKCPPIIPLNPAEAKIRLHLLFRKFVKLFTSDTKPLIIFIDDVQWASISLLELIKDMMLTSEIRRVMFILAYRDNEVMAGHPLLNMLEEIAKQRTYSHIELKPLDKWLVNDMIQDTLLCNNVQANDLTTIIYPKTEGNPFFIKLLLKDLYQSNLLRYSPDTQDWTFDISALKREIKATENVVEFMVTKLKVYPESAQKILNTASCVGNQFNLIDIANILGKDISTISNEIWDAVKNNIIIPLSSDYAIIRESNAAGLDKISEQLYKFQHDRVQQAAYQLVSQDINNKNHYEIGNYFLKIYSKELDKHIIQITSQLNQGREFYVTLEDKFELANYNLRAGRMAVASASYKNALDYFKISLSLLPDKLWGTHYDLMFDLTRSYAECLYVCGKHNEADKNIMALLENAKTDIEKAEIYKMQSILYGVIGRREDSLQISLNALRLLGVSIPEHPSMLKIMYEVMMAKWNRRGRDMETLADMPFIEDKRTKLISDLYIVTVMHALFLSNILLVVYASLKILNLSLSKGNLNASSFGYLAYAAMVLGPTQASRDFAQLGLKVLEKYNIKQHMGKCYFMYAMMAGMHDHWKNNKYYFLKSIELSKETGDLAFLAYSYDHITPYDPTLSIEAKIDQGNKYAAPLQETGYQEVIEIRKTYQHFLYNLCGKSNGRLTMSSPDGYDENDNLKIMQDKPFYYGVAAWHSMKSQIYYLYDEYRLALDEINKADKFIDTLRGSCDYYIHGANVTLTFSALYDIFESRKDKKMAISRIKKERNQFKKLADNCPENFIFHYYIAEAELARIKGDKLRAQDYYKKAIESAEKYQFLNYLAMYTERLARYWMDNQDETLVKLYLEKAIYAYEKWGATEKVKELRERYPDLLFTKSKSDDLDTGQISIDSTVIDLLSLMKSSQAISSEIELDKLLKKLLIILLQNAGAHRVLLISKENDTWFVEAEGTPTEQHISTIHTDQFDQHGDLPRSIIRYVMHTKETALIQSAAEIEHYMTNDEYIRIINPQSILVIPVVYHGDLHSILYLENRSVSMAFKHEHVRILQLLSSQMAISLQNARLYYQATHDSLTRLANRSLFYHLFDLAAKKDTQSTISVWLFDLDNFKKINDTLGHAVGDKVLIHISNLLTMSLGSDTPVARFGGDEFAAMLEYHNIEEVIKAADKFLENIRKPVTIEGHVLNLSSSIGISLYPQDGKNISDLLKQADTALYRVKAKGKNQYQFYSLAHPTVTEPSSTT
jgi:diguanylate cyclase (GGDEF)-like protein